MTRETEKTNASLDSLYRARPMIKSENPGITKRIRRVNTGSVLLNFISANQLVKNYSMLYDLDIVPL